MTSKEIEFFDQIKAKGLSNNEINDLLDQEENPSKMKELYFEYIEIIEGVKNYERQRLKEFLLTKKEAPVNSSKNEESIVKKTKYRGLIYKVSIAAIIILLIFPTYSIFLYNHHLYKTYNIKEYAGNEMGDITSPSFTKDKVYIEAVRLKENGKYEEAIQKFEEVKDESLRIRKQYNIALIYIKLKKYDLAKEILNELNTEFIEQDHYLKKPTQELLEFLNRSKFTFLIKR